MTPKGKLGIAMVLAALAAAAIAVVILRDAGPGPSESYLAAGLDPMTADELSEQYFLLAPEMLTRVYLAFNETEETAIYDRLAEVAAGEALEALYLERVGAMAENGLDPSAEADQQIHTMEMLMIRTRREDQSFTWDARWRVVGTVGHATHLHVRGNTYDALLTVEPVDGAWRITGFELTDVDRADAGQIVEAEP